MLDKRLKRRGNVAVDDSGVLIKGFEADDCMCREVAILAILWAISRLQYELAELIDRPGGTGNTCVD